MSIDDVIKNINRTIVGKIKLMDTLPIGHFMRDVIIVNIGELERIRNDLEKVKETNEKA